jgi:hypothetical protein
MVRLYIVEKYWLRLLHVEVKDLVLLVLCTFETIEICLLVMLVLGSKVIAMFDSS